MPISNKKLPLSLPEVPEGEDPRTFYADLYRRGVIGELPVIPPTKEYCNGIVASRQNYCRRRPGFGTDHPGEGRCRQHGGNYPRGVAHPMYNPTKRRSWASALPSRVGEAFEASLNDPEYLRLKQEIALVDARIKDLLSGLSKDAEAASVRVPELRDSLQKTLRRVEQSQKEEDLEQARQMIRDQVQGFLDLLALFNYDSRIWAEVGSWMDRRQRLAEAEMRQVAQARAMITAQEMMQHVEQLILIIRERVNDPQTLKDLARDISALFGASRNPAVYEVLHV